jgi:hypothetical protein
MGIAIEKIEECFTGLLQEIEKCFTINALIQ